MMSVLERQHRVSDTGAESRRSDSRLVFPPSPTAQGVVDGSWWPRTRDPAAELPDLIAAVTDRLGVVSRIALNADAWDARPPRITIAGQRVVHLDWSHTWAHTIRVIGCDSSRLNLLVIPPDTATTLALACLAIAAGPDYSPRNLRAGHSASCTPVTLRSVPPPVGQSQREQREQVGRWETDGGRVRELT